MYRKHTTSCAKSYKNTRYCITIHFAKEGEKMVKQIIKRDGRVVDYDVSKIESAIIKAMNAVGERELKSAKKLALAVQERLDKEFDEKNPTVEQIQDIVEKTLMSHGQEDVAKAYILYRDKRNRVRVLNTDLMKTYDKITNSSAKDEDIKRENANIDGDTAMGVMLKYGSEGAKNYYLNAILPPDQAKAYVNGDIHIHDFDFYTLTETCCQIDIIKLFKGGFHTGHGFIREPNDIRTYASLVCIAIQANQNDQHGGQAIPAFDYYLAPGVLKTFKKQFKQIMNDYLDLEGLKPLVNMEKLAKDISKLTTIEIDIDEFDTYSKGSEKVHHMLALGYEKALQKTERITYQAMEAFIHNLNTMHSRAGAQVPFSSINFGTDTSPEGRMVMKNYLLALDAGLGHGETPIFPISIFKVKEGINYNPGEPNYDLFHLSCEVSAKRLFPNFSFIDAPFNLQYYKEGDPKTEVAYMGCRTRVMGDVTDPDNQVTPGRGNLSFTSINLPRLGIKHGIITNEKTDMDGFYQELGDLMELVKDQLLERFELQCRKHVYNFPFLLGQGVWTDGDKLKPNDRIRKLLKHGTLTFGFIGLAECLKALIGKHQGESAEAQKLGLEIIGFMRDKADEYSKQYNLNFSLIATPAEGLAGRFVNIDKAIYGKIKGVTDREYYTNSFHVPVYYNISAAKKIEIEAPYHALTNGGHITYIELDGDTTENVEAFEKVVRLMKDAGIGYGAINHPVDRDPVCGFNGVINDKCPGCGREEGDVHFERIRRITGYLVGTVDRFNNGKRAEERDRVKHTLNFKNAKN